MIISVDVNVPEGFVFAQRWYPNRRLLENVAAEAVEKYARNVTEIHEVYKSVVNKETK